MSCCCSAVSVGLLCTGKSYVGSFFCCKLFLTCCSLICCCCCCVSVGFLCIGKSYMGSGFFCCCAVCCCNCCWSCCCCCCCCCFICCSRICSTVCWLVLLSGFTVGGTFTCIGTVLCSVLALFSGFSVTTILAILSVSCFCWLSMDCRLCCACADVRFGGSVFGRAGGLGVGCGGLLCLGWSAGCVWTAACFFSGVSCSPLVLHCCFFLLSIERSLSRVSLKFLGTGVVSGGACPNTVQ